jgi:GAF domain-containing protein
VEPIPETLRAIDEIEAFLDDRTLLEQLTAQAARARAIAPGLRGISVAARIEGLTFTLVATEEESAVLDAVQYATSGPCVEAVEVEHGMATDHHDLLSEPRWQELGQATAAVGIRSTLTFPIMTHGQISGSVNLYGEARDTFDGKHRQLAAVFDAWAPGAISNADLSFMTRRFAEQAPVQLQDQELIDVAVGVIAASHGLDIDAARQRLELAAARAGVSVVQLARTIVQR